VPTAIFTGEYSDSLAAEKWMHSVIPGSSLYARVRQFSSRMPDRLQSNQGLGSGNRNFV